MKIKKAIAGLTATAAALAGGIALATPAQATPDSLAGVLGVGDESLGFDKNRYDFDILREAAEAVLAADSNSPVGVLADGSVPLTAFIPNDRAFQVLEWSLTGSWEWRESEVFDGIVAAAGTLGDPIEVIEGILLYHVYNGELGAVDSATVLSLKGAPKEARTLTMAAGGDVTLRVLSDSPKRPFVVLKDNDRNAFDPTLIRSKLDIRAGEQIAHGISLVLRPTDLPRG